MVYAHDAFPPGTNEEGRTFAERPSGELLLNWFRAKGAISAGVVEGFNNKAKLTIRKAYGFRIFKAIEAALYHTLGNLPELQTTHRFC
jgi:hypothetical protein